MSIENRTTFNGKCHEIYVGDLTLLFSYETLVGFAVPGVGRVSSENVWGPTTGKHINSFPARFSHIERATFAYCEEQLDLFFKGRIGRTALTNRLLKKLDPKPEPVRDIPECGGCEDPENHPHAMDCERGER